MDSTPPECHSHRAPPLTTDGAPWNWGASERFLADCIASHGEQAPGGLRPVVVSKYIPLPWRLLEPRCMLSALRGSGAGVAASLGRALAGNGWGMPCACCSHAVTKCAGRAAQLYAASALPLALAQWAGWGWRRWIATSCTRLWPR